MRLSEFDYKLPAELIAQRPLAERDASRMMVLNRSACRFEDHAFRELPQILQAGDLLVFNNTRVFRARLLGTRQGTRAQPIGKNNPKTREFLRGQVELLLTRREDGEVWQGLVHPEGKCAREKSCYSAGALCRQRCWIEANMAFAESV